VKTDENTDYSHKGQNIRIFEIIEEKRYNVLIIIPELLNQHRGRQVISS